MKNISIILNLILLIAVAVLFYFFFSLKKDMTSKKQEDVPDKLPVEGVAYINSDSLFNKYGFYKDMSEQIEKRRAEMSGNYTRRAQKLQKEIQDFQKNAATMTLSQAQAVEQDLMKQQQELLQYQERLSQELAQEELRINKELYAKVSDYLSAYSKQHNLQVILNYAPGSSVLYADSLLDITVPAIQGLNTAYHNEKVAADSSASQ